MKTRRTTHGRAKRLAVNALEDRSTPAAIAYASATQTLTITAAENDQVIVGTVMDVPGGDINVKVNSVVEFVSAPMSQPVKNVIVRFNGVDHGELYMNPQVNLAGNLTVRGARVTQFMSNQADVAGQFTYLATGSANDDVRFYDTTHIGGNANIMLAAGTNKLYLRGGFFAGNLSVNGGVGDDTVELLADANVTVAKSFAMNLGGGTNKVEGMANHVLEVGKNLSYLGGGLQDTFALAAHHAELTVVGNATFQLGNAPEAASNQLLLGEALVAGNLRAIGGAHDDIVRTYDKFLVNGNFTAQLGSGTNSLNVYLTGTFSQIGGLLNYLGGAGQDYVTVDGLFVDKNMTIALGDCQNDSQFARIGQFDMVFTHGKLTVTGGSRKDEITLRHLTAFNGLAVLTGAGNDLVYLDDVGISGPTVIDLGAGPDDLHIETLPAFAGSSTFNGKFTVFAGAGADWVNFSDDSVATTLILFGGKVSLFGGAGNDYLDNAGNSFSVTGNFKDFEFGDSLP